MLTKLRGGVEAAAPLNTTDLMRRSVMSEANSTGALSPKQQLLALEKQVRQGIKVFAETGFALKKIRDDRLYREAGFETWDAYLKERVGNEFGIEERHARSLISCAQIRQCLPERIGSALPKDGKPAKDWSQREILEFARLAPKKDEPGQPRDLDKLDPRAVKRVADKVLEQCRQEGKDCNSSVVRQVVNKELGIEPGKRESPELPMFIDVIRADTEALHRWNVKLETMVPFKDHLDEHPVAAERFRHDAAQTILLLVQFGVKSALSPFFNDALDLLNQCFEELNGPAPAKDVLRERLRKVFNILSKFGEPDKKKPSACCR
jgi:hypothetical protein